MRLISLAADLTAVIQFIQQVVVAVVHVVQSVVTAINKH